MAATKTVTDAGLTAPRNAPRRPTRLGRYTIGAKLGSGGMGTVYRAHDPELDRDVALKLLHPPSDAGSRLTQARVRMLREAQAIAKVSHPNVIHVYDVGTVVVHDSEQVFVAMELVEGPSMRTWLDDLWETEAWKRGEAWREIVDVVIQTGRGLAAAHTAGLVHRDLKPDNVLLGDDGLVRVVDFGLARRVREEEITAQRDVGAGETTGALDERLTVTGAVLGTPAYMAPEQFRGSRTDERTDQFALGLTLYEALFGLRPFDAASSDGLACAVMTGELRPWPFSPPAPAYLRPIIERALEVDPEDRFASVEELVAALAVDPARTRRRYWAVAGAIATVAAAASAGAMLGGDADEDRCDAGPARVAAYWNGARADELRSALRDPDLPYAERAIEAAVASLDAYAEDWAAAHRDACEATHVRHEQTGELLDRRMACLDHRVARLDATVEELSRRDATSLVKSAPEIAGRLPPVDACSDLTALTRVAPPAEAEMQAKVDDLRTRLTRADAKHDAFRYAEAEAAYLALLPEVDAVGYAPLQAELRLYMASNYHFMAKVDEAIESARGALTTAQAAGHDEVVRDAAARLTVLIGSSKGQPELALMWADLAEATAERIGWTDETRAVLLRNRAWQLAEWGLSDEAIDTCERALEAAEAAFGPDSVQMAAVHSSMGSVYGRLKRLPEAEAQFRRVVELQSKHLGDDHPELIGAYLNLGNALSAQHRLDEAREAFDASIALASRLPDVPADVVARTQSSLGNLLLNEQRWEEALVPHRRALQVREEVLGPDHPMVARSLLSLGSIYTNLERDEEAIAAYECSIAIRERAHGPDAASLIDPLDNLAAHYLRRGDPKRALPYLQRADAIIDATEQDRARWLGHTFWLGRALYESGEDRARGVALVEGIVALDRADSLEQDARAWLDEHR